MSKILLSIAALLLSFNLFAQKNSQWQYLSSNQNITCIEENLNSIWVGTSAGLVEINKQSLKKTYYNKVTSNIPFNSIKKIFFDTQNRLWLIGNSIDFQLTMFDGNTWTVFDIPSFGKSTLRLTDITQTYDGNYWVSDWDGLIFIDKNFQANSGIVKIDSSACEYLGQVYSVEADDLGNLYCGGTAYFSKRDSLGNTNYFSHFNAMIFGDVVFIETDNQDNLWIGSHNIGYVYPSTGGGIVTKYDGDTLIDIGNFSMVNDVSFGANGEIYIATSGDCLVKYHNNQLTYPTLNNPIIDTAWARSVHVDQDGVVWFGTMTGLYKLENNNIQRINISNSFLTSNTVDVYQKKDNTYIYQVMNRPKPLEIPTFKTYIAYSYDTLIPHSTRNLPKIDWKSEDEFGNLWGVSSFSIHKLTDTIHTAFTPDTAMFGRYVRLFDVCYDTINQKLWIGSDEGLISFSNNAFTFESRFLGNTSLTITSVFVDSTSAVWTGSNGAGVAVYKNNSWTSHNFSWTLHNDYIKSITEDKNNALWFTTLYGDIGKYSNNNWTIYNNQNSPLNSYDCSEPAFDSSNTMYVIEGYNGLKILQNNIWDSILFINSSLELFSNKLLIDNYYNLWIIGNGITIYNPNGIILNAEKSSNPKSISTKSFIYPNPANNGFNVSYENKIQYPLKIDIFSISGRNISSNIIKDNEVISTADLSPGVYLVKVEDVNGVKFISKLVIKH